jgi:predicted metal-dependent peptidase
MALGRLDGEIITPQSNVKWPKLKLDMVQADHWDKTRTGALWSQPAFSDIWYAMMVDTDGQQAWFTDQLPPDAIAGTDDKVMYINVVPFFKLPIEQRIFVCCHEICHAMFNHAGLLYSLNKQGTVSYPDGVKLKFIPDIFQIAMDCVINDLLITSKVGEMPEDCWHLPNKITAEKHSVIDAYRILYHASGGTNKKPPPLVKAGGGYGIPGSQGMKAFDAHLEPGQGRGKKPDKAMAERNEHQWDNAITSAMESAKARGRLPENLQRMFTSKIQPTADWREVYGLAVTRKIGNQCYSWSNLDTQLIDRDIGAPGRVQYGCNLLVIAIDSSGSTFQSTVDMFFAETRPIIEIIKPKRIILAQCDADIQEWREIDNCELDAKVKGGGGTDFKPVFERIQRDYEEPDILIYLTDLDGSFPAQAPPYPVIWGYASDYGSGRERQVPFGEIVTIPQQAKG